MPVLIQVCIAVATLALVAVAVALVRTIGQLGRTASQLERTMARLETSIPEIERTVTEARDVLASVSLIAARADRITAQFEETGANVARISSLVSDNVLTPVSNVAAIVQGVRAGASALFSGFFRRRDGHKDVPSLPEERNHE